MNDMSASLDNEQGTDDKHEEDAEVEEARDGLSQEVPSASRNDIRRLQAAVRRLHTKLCHPRVQDMIRVLQHGRSSKLACAEARKLQWDICAQDVQPKIPRPSITTHFVDFKKRVDLDSLSLPQWQNNAWSVKDLNLVCHGTLFRMIIPKWNGTLAIELRKTYSNG